MATWLLAAALSTAIVGFFFLIGAVFRGIRRGIAGAGPATPGDTSWMFGGGGSETLNSAGYESGDHGHNGHHGHHGHGHDAGSFDSAGHGASDSGASDCGGCGGGDGGGGGGE